MYINGISAREWGIRNIDEMTMIFGQPRFFIFSLFYFFTLFFKSLIFQKSEKIWKKKMTLGYSSRQEIFVIFNMKPL